MREIVVSMPNPPPYRTPSPYAGYGGYGGFHSLHSYERPRTMPYKRNRGRSSYGVARNPLVSTRTGRPLAGAALRAVRKSIAKGRVPTHVKYVASAGAAGVRGKPKRSLAARIKKARALGKKRFYRKPKHTSPKKASTTKRRPAAKKGKSSMTKKQRRAAGRKGWRTRLAKKQARRSGKRSRRAARRSRHPKSSRKLAIRRTKVRATVVRVKRRGHRGKGRLALLVPRSKKRSLRGKRWAKRRILYNPGGSTSGGFMATLKSVFSIETVKVVGGGLAGFTLSAGIGEAVARAAVKDPKKNHTAFVLVGAGAGVVTSVTGGVLISRWSPTIGRAFLWGGLLGTAIRALAAAFPGKGLDMPRSAADADALAMKLHSEEAKAGVKEHMTAHRELPGGHYGSGMVAETDDWLQPGSQSGAQDWLPAGEAHSHPAVGSGQTW